MNFAILQMDEDVSGPSLKSLVSSSAFDSWLLPSESDPSSYRNMRKTINIQFRLTKLAVGNITKPHGREHQSIMYTKCPKNIMNTKCPKNIMYTKYPR